MSYKVFLELPWLEPACGLHRVFILFKPDEPQEHAGQWGRLSIPMSCALARVVGGDLAFEFGGSEIFRGI